MSRHWKSQRTEWLNPAAYDALSPDERRRLWGDRKAQRRRTGGARFRRETAVTLVLGAVMAGLGAAKVWPQQERAAAAADASAIHWNEVQAVPKAAADAADTEWERRGASHSNPSTSPDQVGGLPGPADVSELPNVVRGHAGEVPQAGSRATYVFDGDTFEMGGKRIRVANMDAPELHPPRCADEERLGLAAKAKLSAMLGGGAVTLSGSGQDRYGRELRTVAVNGQDVGEAMISAGLAREYGSGRRPWC